MFRFLRMTKRKRTFWKLIIILISLITAATYLNFVQETRIKSRNIFTSLGTLNVSDMVVPFVDTLLISPTNWNMSKQNGSTVSVFRNKLFTVS